MYVIEATIQGIAPILFNRFTEEAKHLLDTRSTGGDKTVEQRQAEALTKVYRNGEGLYLPGECLKKCLLVGSMKASLKHGKKSLTSFLDALVFVEEAEILFHRGEHDFIDERMGRRPPRTGAAVLIRRPGLNPGWELTFHLAVFDDRIQADQVKQALEQAGLLAGLLDNRPSCGRFLIKAGSWIVRKPTFMQV